MVSIKASEIIVNSPVLFQDLVQANNKGTPKIRFTDYYTSMFLLHWIFI